MHIYILDSLLRRTALIDQFVSCIWTERFDEYGDFELVVLSTQGNRRLFQEKTLLACNRSDYVMRVETITDTTDDVGRPLLKIVGPAIEEILEDRTAFGIVDDLTTVPKWTLTGPPATVARKLFHDICVTGILNPNDIIPNVIEGSFLPEDTIPEPVESITVDIVPTTLGEATKSVCKAWSLGFRMLRKDSNHQLYYDIYPGSDRTTKQNILPAVVFTPELDNLRNTSELRSISGAKNVCLIFSPAGAKEVFATDVDPEIEGFERRVLTIQADDITADNPDVDAALTQRAYEELSKCRTISAFDGEIDPNSTYKYGVDYYLGDVVEARNIDGATSDKRVTEQIFAQDAEGERAYPTLTERIFIEAGSWLAWEANQVWSELGPTDYWATA
jgi:hypothetical protein